MHWFGGGGKEGSSGSHSSGPLGVTQLETVSDNVGEAFSSRCFKSQSQPVPNFSKRDMLITDTGHTTRVVFLSGHWTLPSTWPSVSHYRCVSNRRLPGDVDSFSPLGEEPRGSLLWARGQPLPTPPTRTGLPCAKQLPAWQQGRA